MNKRLNFEKKNVNENATVWRFKYIENALNRLNKIDRSPPSPLPIFESDGSGGQWYEVLPTMKQYKSNTSVHLGLLKKSCLTRSDATSNEPINR